MKKTLFFLFFLSVISGHVVLSQVRENPLVKRDEDNMRTRTVLITDETKLFGAGIIAGMRDGQTYIVTALHVVRKMKHPQVRFFREDANLPGEVIQSGDPKSNALEDDIAVIAVRRKEPYKLPVQIQGSGQARYDTDVYVLGHPNMHLWEISAKPDAITEVNGPVLAFQSGIIADGDSGGPLLGNNLRLLVGMLVASEPPHGLAISSAAISKRMDGWHLPFDFPVMDSSPVWLYK